MDIIKIENLKNLIESRNKICVSIYIPTHVKGPETEQNPIRLKNQIRIAENSLRENDFRKEEIDDILKQAHDLITDFNFWQHQSEGLALFLCKDEFYKYRLPSKFEELTTVYRGFNIKPLIPVLSGDITFYLLALDLGETKLYRISKYHIEEEKIPNAPTGFDEAMKYTLGVESLQFHSGKSVGNAQGNGSRSPIYHGHGVGADEKEHKKHIQEFFLQLNKGVTKAINGSNLSLMLAGVDYLIPIYEEANSYPLLLKESITVNPQDLTEKDLHSKAWQIAEAENNKRLHKHKDEYFQFQNNGRSSSDLNEIFRAVFSNKVKCLFVGNEAHIWGNYDSESLEIKVDNEKGNGNVDLIDVAAAQAILHNAEVYVLNKDEMPDGKEVSAVFRY